MKIEMDAAVNVYVFRVLAEILGQKFADQEARSGERAFMCILEGMVASGAAEHRYDESRNLDSSLSTERLLRNWSWVFPGDKFDVARSEPTLPGILTVGGWFPIRQTRYRRGQIELRDRSKEFDRGS